MDGTFSNTKTAAKPGLSPRKWLGALSSALAMASAVSETGCVSAKQMGRVRAMAEAI